MEFGEWNKERFFSSVSSVKRDLLGDLAQQAIPGEIFVIFPYRAVNVQWTVITKGLNQSLIL